MSRSLVQAIETIVRTLHKENAEGFDCDATSDDATEDHDGEMATAGQIISDLHIAGLTISKRRRPARRITRV